MRFCRFGDDRLGLVEGSQVRDVTAALDVLPDYRYPLPRVDQFIANLDSISAKVKDIVADSALADLTGLKLLSPVANPSKIIGAPVNYQKHIDEARADAGINYGNAAHLAPIQKAGVFLKACSSLVGPGEGIALRKLDRRNDHEVELAVVIGKAANKVAAADALDHVAGYAIGLDLTIRGPEERCLRKSPDSYAVLGPWMVTADEIDDPNNLNLKITVNGEVRQDSSTKLMILNVRQLIEYASSFYTLQPGDIILTGTPEGVSPIVPGDTIVATIEKIGSMEVAVRAA